MLSAEQARALAVEALLGHFPLFINDYQYQDGDAFNILVDAAAQGRSVESVCHQLPDAPSSNLLRHYLSRRLFAKTELESLEAN